MKNFDKKLINKLLEIYYSPRFHHIKKNKESEKEFFNSLFYIKKDLKNNHFDIFIYENKKTKKNKPYTFNQDNNKINEKQYYYQKVKLIKNEENCYEFEDLLRYKKGFLYQHGAAYGDYFNFNIFHNYFENIFIRHMIDYSEDIFSFFTQAYWLPKFIEKLKILRRVFNDDVELFNQIHHESNTLVRKSIVNSYSNYLNLLGSQIDLSEVINEMTSLKKRIISEFNKNKKSFLKEKDFIRFYLSSLAKEINSYIELSSNSKSNNSVNINDNNGNYPPSNTNTNKELSIIDNINNIDMADTIDTVDAIDNAISISNDNTVLANDYLRFLQSPFIEKKINKEDGKENRDNKAKNCSSNQQNKECEEQNLSNNNESDDINNFNDDIENNVDLNESHDIDNKEVKNEKQKYSMFKQSCFSLPSFIAELNNLMRQLFLQRYYEMDESDFNIHAKEFNALTQTNNSLYDNFASFNYFVVYNLINIIKTILPELFNESVKYDLENYFDFNLKAQQQRHNEYNKYHLEKNRDEFDKSNNNQSSKNKSFDLDDCHNDINHRSNDSNFTSFQSFLENYSSDFIFIKDNGITFNKGLLSYLRKGFLKIEEKGFFLCLNKVFLEDDFDVSKQFPNTFKHIKTLSFKERCYSLILFFKINFYFNYQKIKNLFHDNEDNVLQAKNKNISNYLELLFQNDFFNEVVNVHGLDGELRNIDFKVLDDFLYRFYQNSTNLFFEDSKAISFPRINLKDKHVFKLLNNLYIRNNAHTGYSYFSIPSTYEKDEDLFRFSKQFENCRAFFKYESKFLFDNTNQVTAYYNFFSKFANLYNQKLKPNLEKQENDFHSYVFDDCNRGNSINNIDVDNNNISINHNKNGNENKYKNEKDGFSIENLQYIFSKLKAIFGENCIDANLFNLSSNSQEQEKNKGEIAITKTLLIKQIQFLIDKLNKDKFSIKEIKQINVRLLKDLNVYHRFFDYNILDLKNVKEEDLQNDREKLGFHQKDLYFDKNNKIHDFNFLKQLILCDKLLQSFVLKENYKDVFVTNYHRFLFNEKLKELDVLDTFTQKLEQKPTYSNSKKANKNCKDIDEDNVLSDGQDAFFQLLLASNNLKDTNNNKEKVLFKSVYNFYLNHKKMIDDSIYQGFFNKSKFKGINAVFESMQDLKFKDYNKNKYLFKQMRSHYVEPYPEYIELLQKINVLRSYFHNYSLIDLLLLINRFEEKTYILVFDILKNQPQHALYLFDKFKFKINENKQYELIDIQDYFDEIGEYIPLSFKYDRNEKVLLKMLKNQNFDYFYHLTHIKNYFHNLDYDFLDIGEKLDGNLYVSNFKRANEKRGEILFKFLKESLDGLTDNNGNPLYLYTNFAFVLYKNKGLFKYDLKYLLKKYNGITYKIHSILKNVNGLIYCFVTSNFFKNNKQDKTKLFFLFIENLLDLFVYLEPLLNYAFNYNFKSNKVVKEFEQDCQKFNFNKPLNHYVKNVQHHFNDIIKNIFKSKASLDKFLTFKTLSDKDKQVYIKRYFK